MKVRTSTGWIEPSALKVRWNNNWISLDHTNFRVRTTTGWLAPIREPEPVQAIPVVSTTSGFSSIMDVSGNPAQQNLSDGTSYGLWVDGPIYPFRGSDGVVRFTVSCSENYMFSVGDWNNGSTWVLNHVMNSPRLAPEGQYSNRYWLFGKYAFSDGRVYCLAHHEWYQTPKTIDGIPGFNAIAGNRRWANGIKWVKSNNNGHSWSTKAAADASSMVIVPEPWNVQGRDTLYGFFHPSNIVKEGSYYYAFVDYRSLPGNTNLLTCGFIMIRTANIEAATGWQYWTGSGWQTMLSTGYMGNLSTQPDPHIFFKVTGNNPYAADPGSVSMAQSIRYHVPSGMWLLFGSNSKWLTNYFCYCASETLANPQFETNGMRQVILSGGGNPVDYGTYGGRYVSVFDPASNDINFQNIMGNTAVCWVTLGYTTYRKQTISIS